MLEAQNKAVVPLRRNTTTTEFQSVMRQNWRSLERMLASVDEGEESDVEEETETDEEEAYTGALETELPSEPQLMVPAARVVNDKQQAMALLTDLGASPAMASSTAVLDCAAVIDEGHALLREMDTASPPQTRRNNQTLPDVGRNGSVEDSFPHAQNPHQPPMSFGRMFLTEAGTKVDLDMLSSFLLEGGVPVDGWGPDALMQLGKELEAGESTLGLVRSGAAATCCCWCRPFPAP
jgi:hypothetical protein